MLVKIKTQVEWWKKKTTCDCFDTFAEIFEFIFFYICYPDAVAKYVKEHNALWN